MMLVVFARELTKHSIMRISYEHHKIYVDRFSTLSKCVEGQKLPEDTDPGSQGRTRTQRLPLFSGTTVWRMKLRCLSKIEINTEQSSCPLRSCLCLFGVG